MSDEDDPYTMERYPEKFQVTLGRQKHNARQIMRFAKTSGRYQDMFRNPLERDKIIEVLKKTGYVEHGGELMKKSKATKIRKEAARELRRRQGRPVIGRAPAGNPVVGSSPTEKLFDLLSNYDHETMSARYVLSKTKRFLEAGANVLAVNDDSESLLYFALRDNLWDVAATLVEYGADPDFLSGDFETAGVSPLIVAVEQGNPPLTFIQLLIDKGAYLEEATAADGMTALGYAVADGNKPVVTTLLNGGADPDIRRYQEHAILARTHMTPQQLEPFFVMLTEAYSMRNRHWEFIGPPPHY